MVAYLRASTKEKTYFDYLWEVREAEKEEVMETSHSQMADNPTKLKVISFFHLQKLKGTQPKDPCYMGGTPERSWCLQRRGCQE